MSHDSEYTFLEVSPRPPDVRGGAGDAPLTPTGEPALPPLRLTVPPYDPPPQPSAGNSRPPMANSTASHSRPPVVGRSGWGAGLLIRLFALSTKFVPIAGVLVGGYYSYTYFFGPVPVVEAAAARLGAAPASSGGSKAGQMLQQTRDVVAANDSRVGFANALAGDLTEGFPETAEPESADPLPVSLAVLPPIEAKVEAPPPAPKVAILDQLAMFEAERAQQDAVAREVETVAIEPGPEPEKVVSSVPPSARFRQWASELRISGVRTGDSPKVMVNGLTLGVGGTIDHRLGITFEGLAQNDQVLVFKDRTDALLTVEY